VPSFGIWRLVDVLKISVSEECVASIFRVEKIRQRGKCYSFAEEEEEDTANS
jgi:hypothetical protein